MEQKSPKSKDTNINKNYIEDEKDQEKEKINKIEFRQEKSTINTKVT